MPLPEGYGIAFGARHQVYAWHPGREKPALLSGSIGCVRDDHVTSLAVLDGILFHAGYSQVVRETGTRNIVGERQRGEIFGLTVHEDRLIAIDYDQRCGTHYDHVRVYDVQTDETLSLIKNEALDLRPGSFQMANLDGRIFIASQNEVMLDYGESGYRVVRLSGYKSDFVLLASDDNQVISTHLPRGQKDSGVQVFQSLPDQGLIREVNLKGYDGVEDRFVSQIALAGNTAVVGARWNYGIRYFAIDLSDPERPPELLSEDLLTPVPGVYAHGNALAVVGIDDLERIIKKAERTKAVFPAT